MELKNGMTVIAPCDGNGGIIKIQEYIVDNVKEEQYGDQYNFTINNGAIYCLLNECAHIDFKNWIIKEQIMQSNRKVFLRMTEEHYMNIPSETREMFLASKRIDSDSHDWEENMKDAVFADIYKVKKEVVKQLQDRQYHLRELRIINK